jgi:hypothetical protein
VIEEIGPAESGKWGVAGFKKVLVEGIHIASQSQGFSDARVSSEEEDAAAALDIIQAGFGLLECLGIEDVFGFNVFVKRGAFETEPCDDIFHDETLPL